MVDHSNLELAGAAGLEPAASWLTARRSAG